MAKIEKWFTCHLGELVKIQYVEGNFFSMDTLANTIGVRVFDMDGSPATLSGTVAANVIRADGNTVAVTGSSEGNRAWVVLPQACYAKPGPLVVVIKLTDNGSTTTLACVIGNVYESVSGSAVDPGTIIPSIEDLIDLINTVAESIPLDYSNLQRQITQEIYDRVAEDAILNGRIDGIVAPTGEAPSAAEVLDARVDVDGTTHQSLGGAIRGQVTEVKNDIEGESLIIHMVKSNGEIVDDVSYYGECIVLKGEKVGMIDIGRNSACTEILSYLNDVGVTKIDYVIISHYHSDHITTSFSSAMDALVAGGIDFSGCTFYLPHKDIDWSQVVGISGSTETAVISKLDALDITHVHPTDNEVVSLSDHLSLKFNNIGSSYYSQYYGYMLDSTNLAAEATTYNNFSLIVTLRHYNNVVLFTGDIHLPAQRANAHNVTKCDLYKVEHHGINYSSDDSWLEVIKPDYAMVSVYSSMYATENTIMRQTISTLSKFGCNISTTNTNAIEFVSRRNGLQKLVGVPLNTVPTGGNWDLVGGVELIKENFDSDHKNSDGKIDLDKLMEPGIYYVMNSSRASANIVDIDVPGIVGNQQNHTLLSLGAPRIQVIRGTSNPRSAMQIVDYPYNDNYRLIRHRDSGNDWSAFNFYATNTIFGNLESIQDLKDAANTVPLYRPFVCGAHQNLSIALVGVSGSGIIVAKRLGSRIDGSLIIAGLRHYGFTIQLSDSAVKYTKFGAEVVYEDYTFSGITYAAGGAVGELVYQNTTTPLTNPTYNYLSATVTYCNANAKMITIPILRHGATTPSIVLNIYRANTEAVSNGSVTVRVAAIPPQQSAW